MKDAQEYIQMILPFSSHMNILYVEDDEVLQKNMEELLKNLFSDVTVASNGVEALSLLASQNFDILITDINMPQMNGIELIKEVKIKNPNQMIVVLSAYNQPNYLMPLLKMGISNYIMKPFDLQRFSMTLLKSILVFEENKNKNEKERVIKEELYKLREENKELKKLLKEQVNNKEESSHQIKTSQVPLVEETSLKDIALLGIDPVSSAQKIDDLIESIDFLANRLKIDKLKKEDIVTIGDLYFELSKEFSRLISLDNYSQSLKELAFGLYDPNFNISNIEKIKSYLFIINDNLQHWIETVLLQQKATTTNYRQSELCSDVTSILELTQDNS